MLAGTDSVHHETNAAHQCITLRAEAARTIDFVHIM